MSLRLATLDPNEPRASKDCRTCNRRRIKCDRTLPTCKKCSLRSLECPGYGLRIRWDQGVASRGKLSGRSLPIEGSPAVTPGAPIKASRDEPPPPPLSTYYSPAPPPSLAPETASGPSAPPPQTWMPSPAATVSSSPSQNASPKFPARVAVSSLLSPAVEEDHVPVTPPNITDYAPYNTGFILDSPYALDLNLNAQPLLPPLRDPSARKLLSYYDHIVAATFPWIEGPENHWRTIMLPMALECYPLLLALLALAAEHYESTRGREWIFQYSRGSAGLRDECLQLLAYELRAEMTEDRTADSNNHSSGILATIIVLCNLEMIRADSAVWSVHWSAARTITRRWTTPPHSPSSLDYYCRFMVFDIFIYDAHASTTTFDGDAPLSADVLHPHDVDIFTEYCRLIQQATVVERARHEDDGEIQIPPFLHDKDTVRREFETVRLDNKLNSMDADFPSADEEKRHDFDLVIDMYHFSGMLYAFQIMLDVDDSQSARQECAETVIQCLKRFHRIEDFQQSFAWALFIAGTELRGSVEGQKYVEQEMLAVMSSTGFGNCHQALEFLRKFWKSSKEEFATWIDCAREQSKKGFKFIVI